MIRSDLDHILFRSAISIALVAALSLSPMHAENGLSASTLRRHFALPAKSLSPLAASSHLSGLARLKAISRHEQMERNGSHGPRTIRLVSTPSRTLRSYQDVTFAEFGNDHYPLRC